MALGVTLTFYWKGNKVKVALAVGKGKQTFDKRDDLKERAPAAR